MKKIISILGIIVLLGIIFFGYQTFFADSSNIVTNNSSDKNNQEQNITSMTKIVAVGDSLTAGYGLNINESYPSQLEKKLSDNGKDVEIINMGVSGETTAGLLERVEFVKKQNPEIIIITIGGNDALRGLPVAETEKNITKIISSFKEVVDSDKIFLANIQAPGNLGFGYTSQFNNLFKNIASREKINLLPFVVPEVFTVDSLMQGDGVHPNREGYSIIVDKYIYPEIADLVD